MANEFYQGVLAALAVVYGHDEETIAEEIIHACGEKPLLETAQEDGDLWLPNLRGTVAAMRQRARNKKRARG